MNLYFHFLLDFQMKHIHSLQLNFLQWETVGDLLISLILVNSRYDFSFIRVNLFENIEHVAIFAQKQQVEHTIHRLRQCRNWAVSRVWINTGINVFDIGYLCLWIVYRHLLRKAMVCCIIIPSNYLIYIKYFLETYTPHCTLEAFYGDRQEKNRKDRLPVTLHHTCIVWFNASSQSHILI